MPPEHPSPDGQYLLLLSFSEVRMSHWIDNPCLRVIKTDEVLFYAPSLWSADLVEWSPESDFVYLSMRVYPGNKPSVELWLYPILRRGKAQPGRFSATPDPGRLVEGTLAEVELYLENYGNANF